MRVWPVFKELESVMDIKNKEALIAEIEQFKEEALKMHIVQVLADTYERSSLFDHNINADGSVIWFKTQARQLWDFWQAAKAQAVPEWISVEDEFPKKNLKVLLNLVTRKNGKPIKCIGFYSIEPDEEPCFVLDDNFTELKGVTHWVRLPDSPKAQEQSHD